MTDIEMKALALWGPGVTAEVNLHNFSILGTAFLEMRDRHEAFRQEVSDAISELSSEYTSMGSYYADKLKRFIIAKPDPLAECLLELDLSEDDELARHDAKWLANAIAKRGGKIVWEGE